MKITLAHSPDADDAFMFYAIAKHKIDLLGYEFEHVLCDIQTLTEHAIAHQTYDISAVSYHGYVYAQEHYEIMNVGSSMGDNYGPILVCNGDPGSVLTNITQHNIAVPGFMTSAYLTLKLWNNSIIATPEPFDQIEGLVRSGKYAAGLIIHEGQLTYQRDGLQKIVDLGEWWFQHTGGLPLPLGGNVIRRSLSAQVKADLAHILKDSIQYSLDHLSEAAQYADSFGRGLDMDRLTRFVQMYVNDMTIDLGERGRAGLREFYRQAAAAGLIPAVPDMR